MANVEMFVKVASSGDHSNSSTDDELPQREQLGLTENPKNAVTFVASSKSNEAEREDACQVAESACEMPLELFDSPDLRNVLSLDVWKSSFSDEERRVLTGFLPPLNEELVGKTVEQLLAGANFHFGSPLSDFLEQLEAGFLQPGVALQRDQSTFLQRQKHYHSVKEYHNRMVNIFAEMQKLWEDHPDAEIDERVEIWKARKYANPKSQIDQQFSKEIIVKNLQKDKWENQSPRKLKDCKSKTAEERAAPLQKRGKNLSGKVEAKELAKLNVTLEGVTRNVKRSCRPGPKGVLKVRDSKVRMSVDHSLTTISVRPKLSHTPSQQVAKLVTGKESSETDKCSSSKSKETAMRGKLAGAMKMQMCKKKDKYEIAKINERKLSVHNEELRWLSQSKNIGKSFDTKHRYSSSLKQDRAALECAHLLEVEGKRSKQGDKFQEVTGTAESGLRKKRPLKEKVVGLLKFQPLKKRPKLEKKVVTKKCPKEDQVLEDHSDEVDLKTESFEHSDDQHNLEQMTNFVRNSGDLKRPYCRKRGKDDTAGGSVNKNVKKEKIQATMNGCLEWKLGLAEDLPKKPLQTFGAKCERTSKLSKKKDTEKLKVQVLDSLNLDINISPPFKSLSQKDGSSFSVKSSRKLVPATSQLMASTFPFSVMHLLSAVRLALICEFVPRSHELHESDQIGGKMNEVRLETSPSDIKRETSESSDGNMATPIQPKYDLSRHDRAEALVSVARNFPVHFSEIVKRVQSNPGDSRLLNSQDLLQDLVRGALKVFSSRIAPAGAKAWKPLTTYDKETRSWSWIGPLPGTSLQDPWDVQILPEAWGIPQKILDKMEETFSNWYKHGQETLKQILEFPLPPPPSMPAVLDEKERFRELRTQKSLITIPPTSGDARAYFRMEELIRYSLPNRSFPYTAADGQKSVVAPLRICGIKLSSKARDHFMLKPDRPPHVTILCLVRDAAARLPQSIGTRADVCTLMRDSQFIIEDVSDAQVNQVVSGALDRLHYERDPCVRFDGDRKLWVYLHSHRHEEDFEDDGTSSTKRWKKPKKELFDNSGFVQKVCENGSTSSQEKLNVNHANLEMNSPDGFDIGENSAIYSVGSAELVYNKSSSLSSPRVLGNSMNRSLADGEGIPFIELPPSLHNENMEYQNGSWTTMRRHEFLWQQGHHFQSNQHFVQAATASSDALPDSLQIE